MTLSEILNNRSHLTDEMFIGQVIVRDKYGNIKHQEEFKSRIERKYLQDKITSLYNDKLKNREWTLSILLK